MSVSSLDRTSGSSYSTLRTLQQQSSLGSIKLVSKIIHNISIPN
jgi:hypothetical protein